MTDVTREADILVVSGSPPDIRDAINRSHAAADARIAALEEENARLRGHIAEQSQHAATRIKDGKAMSASIWRLALEDIVRENIAALGEQP